MMRCAGLLSGLVTLVASPVVADEVVAFQSPTGNIQCELFSTGSGASAMCELRQMVATGQYRPTDCAAGEAWVFEVSETGGGSARCTAAALPDADRSILGYGETLRFGGFTCTSKDHGVTCVNLEGGGFSVSRGDQVVF